MTLSDEGLRYLLDRLLVAGGIVFGLLLLAGFPSAASWLAFTTLMIGAFDVIFYFHLRRALTAWLGLLIFAGLAFTFILRLNETILETEIQGWLTPGTKPSPIAHCREQPYAMRIYFGSAAVCEDRSGVKGDIPVIQVYGDNLLTLNRTPQGLTFSAKIFDENGIVAEIENGEFTVNPNNSFKRKHPDAHTLVVYDKWDVPVVSIEFLNPKAVLITGHFFHKNFGTITADEDLLTIPQFGTFSGASCLVFGAVCIDML